MHVQETTKTIHFFFLVFIHGYLYRVTRTLALISMLLLHAIEERLQVVYIDNQISILCIKALIASRSGQRDDQKTGDQVQVADNSEHFVAPITDELQVVRTESLNCLLQLPGRLHYMRITYVSMELPLAWAIPRIRFPNKITTEPMFINQSSHCLTRTVAFIAV